MDESAAQQSAAHLHARDVGGIDETTVSLDPGVNVLAGRNATNRTSFLQAVMAAVGSDRATLKGDAESGRVTLELGDETHERTLRRVDGGVVFGGDPLLEDPEFADLFAFLLEDNEARRAVERGDDLREIVVRPVDTAELRREIDRLEAEKREVDDELATLDDVAARVENRRQRVADLEAEREDLREELSAAREALADVQTTDGEESEALADLKAARSDLEDARFKLRTERESLESLREQRADLREERDDLPAADVDADDLDARIEDLRRRRSDLEADVGDLQAIVRFNEEMLEDAGGVHEDIAEEVGDGGGDDAAQRSDGGTLTDALLGDDDANVCWTCGTNIERSRIAETVERLHDLRDRKRTRKDDLTAELEELTERRREAADVRERREEIENSLEAVESEIAERQDRVTDLEAERDDLASDVEELEAAVEAADGHEAAVDRAKRVNELEAELDRVEADLADVRETVAELEDRLSERETLEERRADIVGELSDLRDRVDRIESEAVEAFNDHMATVLDRLGYDNVERIWIERTTTTGRDGRRTVEETEFDLHVVRSADGTAYEDTVDHLSESEREVTGLVFALAGYLVHDVYETVPFLLLDSLEAIDAERIAALVDYVGEYTDFLVAALLEEDAQAVENVDNRVTDI
jgi:DNA repair exonuclease SbcCD ATPase subunit